MYLLLPPYMVRIETLLFFDKDCFGIKETMMVDKETNRSQRVRTSPNIPVLSFKILILILEASIVPTNTNCQSFCVID